MAKRRKPRGSLASALRDWTPADTVQLATAGDTAAARDILREFIEAVQLTREHDWPTQLPWPFARYIAEAFRQIVDHGADPTRALGLKALKAGRPTKASKTHDDVALGAAYWLLVRRGSPPEQANQRVHQASGADRRTIQRARDACSSFKGRAQIDEAILVAIVSGHSQLAPLLTGAVGASSLRE